MSVKLIGRIIINSECYILIQYKDTNWEYYYASKITKPLFRGDVGTNTEMGYWVDKKTAESEFKLICEAAQEYGKG